MEEDMAELIVVAGRAQAERIAQELNTAGMTAFVREVAGPQGMFAVVVDRSRLAEARDIAAAFQSCECQQEGNRDEAGPGGPRAHRKPRTGTVE
ncbi:MAG: hypothetical protein ACYDHF_06875 [Candidatus Cryosericum sp.]